MKPFQFYADPTDPKDPPPENVGGGDQPPPPGGGPKPN